VLRDKSPLREGGTERVGRDPFYVEAIL